MLGDSWQDTSQAPTLALEIKGALSGIVLKLSWPSRPVSSESTSGTSDHHRD